VNRTSPFSPQLAATTLALRVYYEDTDAGGIVFYANYLKFFERGRTEWLRALGFDHTYLRKQGQIFVVRDLTLSYRKPAKLDDLLTIHTHVNRIGPASIHFAQQALRQGELLVEGNIQLCCVNRDTLKLGSLPMALRTILQSTRK
jgi:acyl-CoA thioester hydrolase